MAKVYGQRWQLLGCPDLGLGGQGQVFQVVDLTGQHAGKFALKRVLNPGRRERFRSEIEAIKRLCHPNIISLIDHSALDAGATEDKQFLVMPIAQGGDLSNPDRVALYHENLDSVLVVAKQIADGLTAAHAANVIHRDIKPQNILSTGKGHEIWISDFGMCLIRERERITETGEIVGPRAFMAPELEDGGRLEVTAAADVYSLGKVIYYMLTGGVVLPREWLHEPQYSRVFDKGERYWLLYLLLGRMIAPAGKRIQTMEEVSREIEKIEAWEHNAKLLSVSSAGLAAIEQIQRRTQEAERIRSENAAALDQEQQTLATIGQGFTAWLMAELQKVAAVVGDSASSLPLDCGEFADDEDRMKVQTALAEAYISVEGGELSLKSPNDPFKYSHRLQVFLCQEFGPTVSVHVGPQPTTDPQFALLPVYRQTLPSQHPKTVMLGYLTKPSETGAIRGQLTPRFHQGVSQWFPFRASEWPSCIDALRTALTEAVDTFFTFANSGASVIGR